MHSSIVSHALSFCDFTTLTSSSESEIRKDLSLP
jgi:hypothetical protein